MSRDLEYLDRFEVGMYTGILPPEVAQWALPILRTHVTLQHRQAMATRLVRAAATEIGGTRCNQASTIAAIAITLRAAWSYHELAPASPHEVFGMIHRAMQLNPALGTSLRQLLRILK